MGMEMGIWGAWRISVTRGAGGRSQDSADGSRKSESRNMPGRCKFQDAWLAKDIYKEWLLKDPHDIQLARCKACCKAIKLQTMGEAALTSHAVGNGHKAAVRKLVEGGSAASTRHVTAPLDPWKSPGSLVSFYRFPRRDSERRRRWVAAVRRDAWRPGASSRLCSQHFISGKQSKNPLSPDYVPTVFGNITTWRGNNKKPAAPETERMLSNNETQDAATASATVPGQENSATPRSIVDEEEQVALILHLNSNDPSTALDHGVVGTSSTAHNASFQEVGFPTSYIDSCGIPTLSSVGCGGSRVPAHNNNNNNHHPHLLLQQPPHQQQHHNTSPSPAHRRRHEEPGRDVALPPHTPPRRPRPAVAAAAAAAALAKRNREQRERAAVLQAQAETELEMDERRCCGRRGGADGRRPAPYRMKRRYLRRQAEEDGPGRPTPAPLFPPPPPGASGDEGVWGRSERLAKEEAAV
ncbi:hypothetical protein CRUP_002465 [Coryphaenoides rupestris]|nr:hypothetical protein CRUP_002465 [Coryphaenoides rupestris]